MVSHNDKGKALDTSTIYLSVDHLEKGRYWLHILQDDKVIKKIEFKK